MRAGSDIGKVPSVDASVSARSSATLDSSGTTRCLPFPTSPSTASSPIRARSQTQPQSPRQKNLPQDHSLGLRFPSLDFSVPSDLPTSPRGPTRIYPRFRVNSAHALGNPGPGLLVRYPSALKNETGLPISRSSSTAGHARTTTGSGPTVPGLMLRSGLKISTDMPPLHDGCESPATSPIRMRLRRSRGEALDADDLVRRGMRAVKATKTVMEVLESEGRFKDGLRVVIEVGHS